MIANFTPYGTIKRMKNNRGFTLVEIMAVVFIISFLLSLAVVQGVKLRKMANESNAQANLKGIAASFEIYAAGRGGAYAESEENDMKFLVDAKCATQDFITLGQIGNFRYTLGRISPEGYDIRAMAVSQALADHNYQITTGGMLKRSNTAGLSDTDFKIY